MKNVESVGEQNVYIHKTKYDREEKYDRKQESGRHIKQYEIK